MSYKCSFCSKAIPLGRGKVFVKNDGRMFHFCDSKCQANWNMGREPKNLKWTETHRKAAGKTGSKRKGKR